MSDAREFILYLEPTKSTAFRNSIDRFLEEQVDRYYPTTATKYSCHVSMTGFFKIPNEPELITDICQLLSNILLNKDDCSLLHLLPAPQVAKEPMHTTSRLFSHLLLPVLAPEPYHQIVRQFAERCCERDDRITVRTKATNHISLAYWDEPHATQEQNQQWYVLTMIEHLLERMQEDVRQEFKDLPNAANWDIVLYERVSVGWQVGMRHQFVEHGRWPIARETSDQ
ncbi:hypothetical protein EC973_000801 [Apophysomyces ossiformis]|uniref:Uncharacterized protein n=1 Tax=Apophysomyces ossiformis TaxID=679940 RepID=A0A8H7EMV7_9FUNG|nr:hypothetical protein EC973_000801 [Apophysomyces ossiformis]